MIKYENAKVTVRGNLIVTDDLPQVDLSAERPVYELDHRNNIVGNNLPMHLALVDAKTFWQKFGFCLRLLTGRYRSKVKAGDLL